MFVRILSSVSAAAAIAALVLTGTASASGDTVDRVPLGAKVAKVADGAEPVVQLDKQAYLRGAEQVGAALTEAQKADVNAAAVTCWSWDAWRKGYNVFGNQLWTSHHKMNWCGDGSWVRVHAYTERWGETHWVGWNDKGVTQQGQQYGVNWNQYNSWTQRKFCYVEYFDCVQESNPYHNTTAFPNGAAQWN
jgi:hypothetical protein